MHIYPINITQIVKYWYICYSILQNFKIQPLLFCINIIYDLHERNFPYCLNKIKIHIPHKLSFCYKNPVINLFKLWQDIKWNNSNIRVKNKQTQITY